MGEQSHRGSTPQRSSHIASEGKKSTNYVHSTIMKIMYFHCNNSAQAMPASLGSMPPMLSLQGLILMNPR
ncbi:hypothetical protein O988_05995 [Pseudogymnoascus sp. VKM F-3808]|nr:hypothetical protein O988_05995 [Pseudogymnoascus sp. VKM F-3808]